MSSMHRLARRALRLLRRAAYFGLESDRRSLSMLVGSINWSESITPHLSQEEQDESSVLISVVMIRVAQDEGTSYNELMAMVDERASLSPVHCALAELAIFSLTRASLLLLTLDSMTFNDDQESVLNIELPWDLSQAIIDTEPTSDDDIISDMKAMIRDGEKMLSGIRVVLTESALRRAYEVQGRAGLDILHPKILEILENHNKYWKLQP